MASSSGKGIGSAKPKKGNNDSAKLEEVIDIYKFQDHPDEWVRIRLLEKGLIAVKRHWCKIIAGKTEKREVSVPRFCISFDPENETEPKAGVECPYCSAVTENRETSPVTSEFFYLTNAIIRDIQEDEPARKSPPTTAEKKTGFKDIKSKTWTPVRVVRLTNGVVSRIQELMETNVVKNKKTGKKVAYDLSHPKYGVDLNIKFKPKKAGSEKYSVDKADDGRIAITEEEDAYLVYRLDEALLDACGRMDAKQSLEDFKRMELSGGEEIDEDDEEDDDDIPLGRKSNKKKKSSKSAFDEEDEDDDLPKKKKKKASKSDDDDDEEEDEAPKKKKKKSSDKSDKKSSKSKDKVKSKKASKSDGDDDDEDEAPKKQKKSDKSDKKSSKSKDKKSSKKSSFDDDDDNW